MNLPDTQHLVAFNQWANQQFFDALRQLPAEQYMRDLHSSHGGIHGTLQHLVGTEKQWVFRWLQRPESVAPGLEQIASLADLRLFWEDTCTETARFVAGLNDRTLQEVLTTESRSGRVTVTCWQMLQHVVDHSSYHRGQIVSMLRQLGVTPPSTGMMRFHRESGEGTEG
jgi:uncharacterized damage-inducible protein DinB